MTALASVEPTFDPQQLRAFPEIPLYHHGVVAFCGSVLAYETDCLSREGMIAGALYVVENQRPVSGMQWDMHDRLNRERVERGEPRVRLHTVRRVVQARPWPTRPEDWALVTPEGFVDGPYPDWSVMFDIVGKVVGIYRPEAAVVPPQPVRRRRARPAHVRAQPLVLPAPSNLNAEVAA